MSRGGFDRNEIAELLGVTPNSVRVGLNELKRQTARARRVEKRTGIEPKENSNSQERMALQMKIKGSGKRIHGARDRFHPYFWVTRQGCCWETRDLSRDCDRLIDNGTYSDRAHDFSMFLNAWQLVVARLTTN